MYEPEEDQNDIPIKPIGSVSADVQPVSILRRSTTQSTSQRLYSQRSSQLHFRGLETSA